MANVWVPKVGDKIMVLRNDAWARFNSDRDVKLSPKIGVIVDFSRDYRADRSDIPSILVEFEDFSEGHNGRGHSYNAHDESITCMYYMAARDIMLIEHDNFMLERSGENGN